MFLRRSTPFLRRGKLTSKFMMQAGLFTGFFSRALPIVRNRLLLDPRFLFKVGVEVAIDAGTLYARICWCIHHIAAA